MSVLIRYECFGCGKARDMTPAEKAWAICRCGAHNWRSMGAAPAMYENPSGAASSGPVEGRRTAK